MGLKKARISSLASKAQKALRQAVRQVIVEHRRTGKPIAIWRAGKVVQVSAARFSHV
jgi:hypothetical protein